MIDKAIIKANFSRMSDTELIHLAENEGHDLTSDALLILQEEFSKRKLDMSVFGMVEDNKIAEKQMRIERAKEKGSEAFMNSIWTYALDEKMEGKTDKEILAGIIDQGLDEEDAAEVINTLEAKAKSISDAHDTNMLVGGLICTLGIGVTLWTYSASLTGGTYVVAWGAILFGAIRFFRGMADKGKYKAILAKIQAGKDVHK
jgi:hypothetical protein